MRTAVFLHGTNGDTSHHWWPWLRKQFEINGYSVQAPHLPDNDRPNEETYWNFLTSKNWKFEDSVLVGHSSGATTVLNLLSREEFPQVDTAILIGVFLNQKLTRGSADFEDDGQFDHLFPPHGFDWNAIKAKARRIYVVHGDDDPYCSYNDAVSAANALGARLITIPKGGHLSTRFGVVELPALTEALKEDGLFDEDH